MAYDLNALEELHATTEGPVVAMRWYEAIDAAFPELLADLRALRAVEKAMREEVLADAHPEDWPMSVAALAALDAARRT